jgi:integrase
MRVLFFLRNPKKKGKTAIYATLRYGGQRVIIFPGESIETSLWINKKNMNKPKSVPQNNSLIGRLNRAEQLYRDVHDNLQSKINGIVPPEKLKEAIYEKMYPQYKNETTTMRIIDFFEVFIEDSKAGERLTNNKTKLSEGSIKPYRSASNHFGEFEKLKKRKFYLTDIDQNLIDDFIKYLNVTKKLSINASAKYLTAFKSLMSYAKKKKLITTEVLLENTVDIRRERSDTIYLNEKEIEGLLALQDFENPTHEVVRDLFVIGCKTGLRFSDYSKLRLENIHNGKIQINQIKTRNRVTIPVHPIVQSILDKYPNGLPKCPTNQAFNRCLKDIGEKVPELCKEFEKKITRANVVERKTYVKWRLLQSHSARRSFATNEYLEGTDLLTIMNITGHTTQKAFLTYIKATDEEHAELLRKEWEKRNIKRGN